MARWEHFLLTLGFCGFFLIHVTQVVLAGWNNFRSMVSGLEVKPIQETSLEAERKSWGMSDLDETEVAEQKAADEAVLKESRKHTRRSFAIAAAAAAAGWGVYEWIDNSQRLSISRSPSAGSSRPTPGFRAPSSTSGHWRRPIRSNVPRNCG